MNDIDYATEITKMVVMIIENKEYDILARILSNYDVLIKEQNGITDQPLPFWCYNMSENAEGDKDEI